MADGVKNTVFMMIFTSPGGKPDSTTNDRMLFLGKLISLAISMKSSLLLNCAGVWMQVIKSVSLNLERKEYPHLLPSHEK